MVIILIFKSKLLFLITTFINLKGKEYYGNL
jgi:hypothetical protein